jgi:twinkle protein
MLIPKDKVAEAKESFGDKAIKEITDYFNITNFDEKGGKCSCPLGHVDKTPSFIWNSKNNSFHCFSCGKNFNIIDLYLLQGMTYLEAIKKLFEQTNIQFKFGEMGVQTKRAYKYPKRECNDNRKQIEEYMATRKISIDTLNYADIQADDKNNITFHYYDSNDVLLTIKYRPAHKLSKEETKCWFQQGSDNTPILFNMNRIDPNEPLVITEGEIDTLAIIESGYKNVVSVPGGAQNMRWIDECWDWLEQFEKIIIWSDNDEPGMKMRKDACYRLGAWRTSYIDIGEIPIEYGSDKMCKDANDVLIFYGKEKVLEFINNPKDIPVDGIVNAAKIKRFEIDKAEGLYTGIEELDRQIYKLVFGNVCVLTGKRGDGKSSFANQLVNQSLNQGYDAFIYSQELPNSVLVDWIDTNLLGPEYITLKDGQVRIFDNEKYREMRKWYDSHLWVYDNNQVTDVNHLFNKMEESVRKLGVRVLLLDNLMTIDLSGIKAESKLEEQKIFIQKLVSFALRFNVLIFLVCHPRKNPSGENNFTLDDVAGASEITNLVQYTFWIYRYTPEEKEGEKNRNGDYIKGKEPVKYDTFIKVDKNRITGDLPKVNLWYDKKSSRFYNQTKELWFRYKWDSSTEPIPTHNPKDKEGDSPL